MPIYQDAEIVWLEHWSIHESADGATHIVGCSQETHNGRVGTKIFYLDKATRTAYTSSGRIYQLVGSSGRNNDAEYALNTAAKGIGNGKPWRDVTAELIPDCHERKAVTANCEEVTLDAAARLLAISRTYVKILISRAKIPSRMGDGGVQWIPITALTEYRTKMRAELETALEAIMCESERTEPYDADFPLRGASGKDETR